MGHDGGGRYQSSVAKPNGSIGPGQSARMPALAMVGTQLAVPKAGVARAGSTPDELCPTAAQRRPCVDPPVRGAPVIALRHVSRHGPFELGAVWRHARPAWPRRSRWSRARREPGRQSPDSSSAGSGSDRPRRNRVRSGTAGRAPTPTAARDCRLRPGRGRDGRWPSSGGSPPPVAASRSGSRRPTPNGDRRARPPPCPDPNGSGASWVGRRAWWSRSGGRAASPAGAVRGEARRRQQDWRRESSPWRRR